MARTIDLIKDGAKLYKVQFLSKDVFSYDAPFNVQFMKGYVYED